MKQDMICPGPLMEDALSEAVAEFFRNIRPGRERLFDYYRGEQPVPKGPSIRGRPNSLLWVPFPPLYYGNTYGLFPGVSPDPAPFPPDPFGKPPFDIRCGKRTAAKGEGSGGRLERCSKTGNMKQEQLSGGMLK